MRYVLATLVLLPTVALAVSLIRGRARVRSCCSDDATKDLRMRR